MTAKAHTIGGQRGTADDSRPSKRVLINFDVICVYLAATFGGYAGGGTYLAPYIGQFTGSLVGLLCGGLFAFLALIKYTSSK